MSIPGARGLALTLALAWPLVWPLASPMAHAQHSPDPTPAAIMAQVAANQDRAEAERAHYVYLQHARVVSRKGSTVMCEEITDSRVTPEPAGVHTELVRLSGRLLRKGKYTAYTEMPAKNDPSNPKNAGSEDSVSVSLSNDDEADQDIVEHIRGNLLNDKSRDGLNARLFPLTTKNQGDYVFRLLRRERMNGRDVFHLVFKPKDNSDFDWKGDAYIDAAVFQPVVVRTDLSRKVPMAVRALLGTNVPGLGFTVVYAPQPDGVWFPVSFGSEFKFHILFFFRRQIIIDAQNTAFEKTHTGARILSGPDNMQGETVPR